MLHVVVTNVSQRSYAFGFETVETVREVTGYRNRKYVVSIDEAVIYDADNEPCDVQTGEATVSFSKSTVDVVAAKAVSGEVGAYVATRQGQSVIRLSDADE